MGRRSRAPRLQPRARQVHALSRPCSPARPTRAERTGSKKAREHRSSRAQYFTSRRDSVSQLASLYRMLLRHLDSNRAILRQLDYEILSPAMLLLSQRASTGTKRETKRAKQHAAHERATSNAPRPDPLHIISGSLNRGRNNVARIELLNVRTRPVKRRVDHASVRLKLHQARLQSAETSRLKVGPPLSLREHLP